MIRVFIAIDQNGRIWADGFDSLIVRETALAQMDQAVRKRDPYMEGLNELEFALVDIEVSEQPHLN